MFDFGQGAEIKDEMYNLVVSTGPKQHIKETVSGLTENITHHEYKGQTLKRCSDTKSLFGVKKRRENTNTICWRSKLTFRRLMSTIVVVPHR